MVWVVELVLNTEGRWGCEGDLAWKGSLTKRLRLGGEDTSLCVVHRLWWWRPGGYCRVDVVRQHYSHNGGDHGGGVRSGLDG